MNKEQTPTNKDSLLVEHIPFDLEWAKRGGVVFYEGEFFRYLNSGYDYILICPIYPCGPEPMSFELDGIGDLLRMATPAECEAVGVKYIEKPVSAEELAELRKDSERLRFLRDDCMVVLWRGAVCACVDYDDAWKIELNSCPFSFYGSADEAIDAAMAVLKGGD